MARDPFSLIYDCLWDTLEAHRGFRDLVRDGNRVKLSGRDRSPIKEQAQAGDLPEVRIVATGVTPHLNRTSSKSSVMVSFEIGIATGDQRLDAGVFPVAWEIIRALSAEETTPKLVALKWDGATFVVTAKAGAVNVGASDVDLNRGIVGWSALWAVELELWFPTASIGPVA